MNSDRVSAQVPSGDARPSGDNPGRPRVVIFTYRNQTPPSTFIQRHVDDIGYGPDSLMQLAGWSTPQLGSVPLWGRSMPARLLRRVRSSLGTGKTALHQHAFAGALRKLKPDAVLAEFGYSGTHIDGVCRRLGIPLVVHFHGTDINRREVFEQQKEGYRRLGHTAHALITVSQLEKNKLTAAGLPADRIHVIPCGAILPDTPSAMRPRNPDEPLAFVSTTRMSEVKAPHLVITAFARFLASGGQGQLHMIGDGPLLPFCQSLAKGFSLGDRCIFHGSIPHDAVLRILASADAYVQHSVVARDGDCEGMPVSLMEAAGRGLPIITSAVGGIPEYFTDGESALLISEYDTAQMAAAMLRIQQSPELAAALGRHARNLALQQFDSTRQSAAVVDVIRSVINPARPQRSPIT